MKQHETYSVLITDEEKGKRGTGTLFYTEGSEHFYVLTCAHVIYTSDAVKLQILIQGEDDSIELTAGKTQFHFSPIDHPTLIGNESTHTCDIAVIECKVGDLPFSPTKYALYPMTNGERVIAVGYPNGIAGPVYYQQADLKAEVMRIDESQPYFVIRVDDASVNTADRYGELKGLSGSPVWDEQNLQKDVYLFGGLIAFGVGNNISMGRVNVMNARLLQSLMRDEFGIKIKTINPMIPESDIAPGYEEQEEFSDEQIVRAGWIENERRKAHTYIDSLQLLKATETLRAAISNKEFEKCSVEQKYSLYAMLLEAYRLARDFDVYDSLVEEMHSRGIYSDREDLTEAIRFYEALDNDKAEEYIRKALEKNPEGNQERVVALAVRAAKEENAGLSILSEVLGSRDQLLLKPKDDEEEEGIYQILGYILTNVFKETGRAIRCLNRAFQINGNSIILETLGITYYLHSIRDAFIEVGSDRIDQSKIEIAEIEKARDSLLRVFSSADEVWMKGTFKRAGLQIFKCFYFMHDNFRIYKHYHDVMKYFEFPDRETKRDIQICYLETAFRKEEINFEEFDALTDFDRQFFKLLILLEKPMMLFNGGLAVSADISEAELMDILKYGEKQLQDLTESKTDDRLGFDGIHTTFANLYGNGILRYKWNAIDEVKRHCNAIVNPHAAEPMKIYIDELQAVDLNSIERRYEKYFEKHQDVITYCEWIRFYIRHGWIDRAKDLYESVFNERQYLIEDQPEYFYRSYVDFIMTNRLDITPAIRCFVENRNSFKDIFIYMSFEMDLNFCTVTFNDPDRMIADASVLLNEGLYTQRDYDEKCLIINMLNCRPNVAEKYAAWAKGAYPEVGSFAERMLLVWKGAPIEQNRHWHSMKTYKIEDMVNFYKNESWTRNPEEILAECNTAQKKEIVVDLWTLYLFTKDNLLNVFDAFKTIYVTHNTVSMALQEINQVSDDDIRKLLIPLQTAPNVRILSPTLEQQLQVRDDTYEFMEIHSACLLAQELNCPAFVGENRFEIPEKLRSKVVRPHNIDAVMECVLGVRLIDVKKC